MRLRTARRRVAGPTHESKRRTPRGRSSYWPLHQPPRAVQLAARGGLPCPGPTPPSPTLTRVTNQIRALRFSAGQMTQGELADRIGVTRQTLNAIEQGKCSPSLEVAFKIARVFAVPLEQVFQYP
jgi:putative transcriptional regulator